MTAGRRTPVPLVAPRAADAPAWPHRLLDVAALRARGVRPVPFRQFVLKLRARCNLDCRYCYVYHGADGGWRDHPDRLDERTLRRTAWRVAEHASRHALPAVELVLHGGEPLLGGPATALRCREAVAAALPPDVALTVGVQTNGTLLTPHVVDQLADAGVRVGVSLDGGLPAHNTDRVDHAGRPAWRAVARGLRALAGRPEAYAGLLCVIDPDRDPDEVYESLLAFRPPAVDLLLPHGNWTSPPPGRPPSAADTRYGDWLIRVFDRWWTARRPGPRVRLFEEVVLLLLGAASATEALGGTPVATVVVESDGAIEQVDSLKSAYDGAAATGLDVFTHSFDDALEHPGVAARQIGAAALSDTCRACPVGEVCGGGNYAHRYRAGSGFQHPSVYCADLQHLIRHAAGRLADDATGAVARTTAASR